MIHDNDDVASDHQSLNSGTSGGLPSLVSHSINYFGLKTDEANDSGQITEESDVSEDTNSMAVEQSEHESHNDVNLTHSTISDHEGEEDDDDDYPRTPKEE